MLFPVSAQAPQARPTRLLSGAFGPKKALGDGRWTSHSPTGSGPEGSSPNEVRIGSLVSLLPVFRANRAGSGDPCFALDSVPFLKPAPRDNQFADRPMNDAGAPSNQPDSADQGGFDLGGAP